MGKGKENFFHCWKYIFPLVANEDTFRLSMSKIQPYRRVGIVNSNVPGIFHFFAFGYRTLEVGREGKALNRAWSPMAS